MADPHTDPFQGQVERVRLTINNSQARRHARNHGFPTQNEVSTMSERQHINKLHDRGAAMISLSSEPHPRRIRRALRRRGPEPRHRRAGVRIDQAAVAERRDLRDPSRGPAGFTTAEEDRCPRP